MNEHISPEFEGRLHELLAAPDAGPEFVNGLRSKLIQTTTGKPIHRLAPRLAWGIAVALVLLVAGLLMFSPQVVEAMKRLLGYFPGIGYVEKGTALRVLSAPVTIEKDGLKVTIEKGAADPQRTVLLAHIEGVTQDPYGERFCATPSRLVLPDGTALIATQYENSMVSGQAGFQGVYEGRYVFGAMPPSQLDATLQIGCVLNNADYADFRFPLHFKTADEAQVAPVIALPTMAVTTDLPPQGGATISPTQSAEASVEGFTIVLDSVAPLEDGYILAGHYQWNDVRTDRSAVTISDSNITDANGQDIPYQEVGSDSAAVTGAQQIPFAYQITGKDHSWPLSITVNAVSVVQAGQGTFEFDAGPSPQAGQSWAVNIDVPVAGHVIHVESIGLTAGRTPSQLGFDFTMTSDARVAGATVEDMNPIIDCTGGCGGGGGGGGGADYGVSGFDGATGPFYYGSAAEGYSPAGLKTFVISNVSVFFKGPWQVQWQP